MEGHTEIQWADGTHRFHSSQPWPPPPLGTLAMLNSLLPAHLPPALPTHHTGVFNESSFKRKNKEEKLQITKNRIITLQLLVLGNFTPVLL